MESDLEKSMDEWRARIEFYGKVVDENTNPVAAAQVRFVWTDLSPKGNSRSQTSSDKDGLFALHHVTGKNLIVKVEKAGYYEYAAAGLSFNFAGENENFVADPRSPVIFVLKRKGPTEDLFYCKNNFHVERNGTPLAVDLTGCCKAVKDGGQILVECWTDDQGKQSGEHYDWMCRLSVPGGGIVQSTNVFDFVAPSDGYKPFDEIIMLKATPLGWSSSVKRSYFGKTADGNFFRLSFEIIAAGDHFFEIESFLNPSGSGNLEFDPGKVIQAK